MFKLVRIFTFPMRFIINLLQNFFIQYFEPMSLGPVSSLEWKLLIKENFNDKINVIDFGCGTGSFCLLFDPNRYLGLDINDKFIEIAKKRYQSYNFVNSLKLKDVDSKFNNILFNGVLHHLDDKTFSNIILDLKNTINSNCDIIFIEPIIPNNIFSLEFMVKIFDLGDYIRDSKNYIKLIKKNLTYISCSSTKIGWNNLVIIKSKLK